MYWYCWLLNYPLVLFEAKVHRTNSWSVLCQLQEMPARNPFVDTASHIVFYGFKCDKYNYFVWKVLSNFWMLKIDIKFGKSSDWKNQANVWPWLDLAGSGPTERRRRLRFITSLGNHLEAATNISTLISAKAVNRIVSRESSPACLKVKRRRLRSMWIMNLGSRIYVLLHSNLLWMRYPVDLDFP